MYSDGNSARVVAYPVGSEDYYVMSGAFYRSEDSMSVMEVLAKDYIKGNSIDSGMLDRVIEDYYKWSRVEQYYYGAVLLTVIKDVVRSSKI
jgi:CTP:phosphocholine cytidylyltransferase-like protein